MCQTLGVLGQPLSLQGSMHHVCVDARLSDALRDTSEQTFCSTCKFILDKRRKEKEKERREKNKRMMSQNVRSNFLNNSEDI